MTAKEHLRNYMAWSNAGEKLYIERVVIKAIEDFAAEKDKTIEELEERIAAYEYSDKLNRE